MTGQRRTLVVTCAALIGWALGYALPIYARLPNLYYDPQHARWLWGARPGAVPMGYYGQLLWGTGGALLAGAIAWVAAMVVARRGPAVAGGSVEPSAGLLAAWTLTALVLVGAWFTWNNWP